jgi:hypothetical protein
MKRVRDTCWECRTQPLAFKLAVTSSNHFGAWKAGHLINCKRLPGKMAETPLLNFSQVLHSQMSLTGGRCFHCGHFSASRAEPQTNSGVALHPRDRLPGVRSEINALLTHLERLSAERDAILAELDSIVYVPSFDITSRDYQRHLRMVPSGACWANLATLSTPAFS